MNLQELNAFIKETYKEVRDDPTKIEEVIGKVLQKENTVKKLHNYRVISFLALKNDLILQNELKKENIDNYILDLIYCIENELYKKGHGETPVKIFEMIAKIQYAFNLLNHPMSLKKLYESFLLEFNKDFSSYFNYFKNRKILYDHHQLAFIYNIYYLFVYDYDISIYREFPKDALNEKNLMETLSKNKTYYFILMSLIFRMKEYKMHYYDLKFEDIEKEGFTEYNFIF